mmetsp:Transcript_30523/g.73324  ORF Transcript_30523/g.73324 Transcript_30523/m.73324 type:complete len:226 (-) Transcript_30523:50-727(-)
MPVPMPSPEPTVTPCPLITPEPTVTPSPDPIPSPTCTPAPTTSPFWKSAPAPCAATSPLFIICSVPAKFLMWWKVEPSVTGGGEESSVVAITKPGSFTGVPPAGSSSACSPPSSAGASSAGVSSTGASAAASAGTSAAGASSWSLVSCNCLFPSMSDCARATRCGSANSVHTTSAALACESSAPPLATRIRAVIAIARAAAPMTLRNRRSEFWRLGATAPYASMS